LLALGVRRAVALRVKYAVDDGSIDRRRHLQPEFLGVHPENRNGVGLSGARCEELLRMVFKKWDDETANHGSVCVQEQPGKTIFLDYGYDEKQPEKFHHRVPSLAEAAYIIVRKVK
jgi:hypothetical protein